MPVRMSPDQKVSSFHEYASAKLNEIAEMLTPGMEITLVVCRPGFPERDAVLCGIGGDLDEAIAAIQRRKGMEGTVR
jgi:hypothetical protein